MDIKKMEKIEEKTQAFVNQTLDVLGYSTDGIEERLSLMGSLLASWLNKEYEAVPEDEQLKRVGMCNTALHIGLGKVHESLGTIVQRTLNT